MTECNETLFPFEAHFSRRVVAQFAGRQEHAEPVGAAPDWFPCHGTLQQDQLFRRSARRTAGRSISGSAPARTARDRAGSGRHRHAVAWTAGSTFLPRLLRALLLFATVCVLRRS